MGGLPSIVMTVVVVVVVVVSKLQVLFIGLVLLTSEMPGPVTVP